MSTTERHFQNTHKHHEESTRSLYRGVQGVFTIDARVRTTAKPSNPMQVLQFAIFLIEKNYNYKNYKTSVSFVFIIFVRTCTTLKLRKPSKKNSDFLMALQFKPRTGIGSAVEMIICNFHVKTLRSIL